MVPWLTPWFTCGPPCRDLDATTGLILSSHCDFGLYRRYFYLGLASQSLSCHGFAIVLLSVLVGRCATPLARSSSYYKKTQPMRTESRGGLCRTSLKIGTSGSP